MITRLGHLTKAVSKKSRKERTNQSILARTGLRGEGGDLLAARRKANSNSRFSKQSWYSGPEADRILSISM